MSSLDGLRAVSSHKKKDSDECCPSVASYRSRLEALASQTHSTLIQKINTRSYNPTPETLRELGDLFGQACCSSPYSSKGWVFALIFIIFLILLIGLFFCGGSFYGSYYVLGAIIFIIFLIILGLAFFSVGRDQSTACCKV